VNSQARLNSVHRSDGPPEIKSTVRGIFLRSVLRYHSPDFRWHLHGCKKWAVFFKAPLAKKALSR
jgi:hypothetical protein